MPENPDRTPLGAVGEPESYPGPSDGAEAPPGPSVSPPAPVLPEPAADDLSVEQQRIRLLQQRLRLNALVQRLHEARPKRVWGVRALDWTAMETAARAATQLPTGQWEVWRAAARFGA